MDALQGVAIDEDSEAVAARSPTKPLISEVSTTGAAKLRYHRQQLEHPFLVRHQEDIIIFSTESNLRHVACVDTLYMDGTFEVCPSTFYQICTIHTCATWQEQRNFQNIDLDFNPQHTMPDFELALIQSIHINFPATPHKSCSYHFRLLPL